MTLAWKGLFREFLTSRRLKYRSITPSRAASCVQLSMPSGPGIFERNFARRVCRAILSPQCFMGAQNSKAVDADRGGSRRSVTSLMTGETFQIHGLHHAGLLCENLELSMQFYSDFLGLRLNPDRPDARLDFRGAWFWVGTEMIHLMEVPNPDPKEGRPEEGGRDKHICIAVESLQPLIDKLNDANLVFTRSLSGRKAIFVRDPDMNCLEFVETEAWRG